MSDSLWADLQPKLVAILRGLPPVDAAPMTEALIEAGFRAIEVPLNSPDPFRSIETAARVAEATLPGRCLIGAGTVLTPEDARQLHACGGNLVVAPNIDVAVVAAARECGMATMPGVFTATEALAAVAAGATALKFFPASLLGPSGIAAIRAVLPSETSLCAVGGVGPKNFDDFREAGVQAFGLGTSLYRPGDAVADVAKRAAEAVAAY